MWWLAVSLFQRFLFPNSFTQRRFLLLLLSIRRHIVYSCLATLATSCGYSKNEKSQSLKRLF